MKFLFLSLLLAHAARAQPGLENPQAGMMLDHSGALRPVTGIGHSFLVGEPLQTKVLSAACAPTWCVAKTAKSLLVPRNSGDTSTPAPAGPAIFSVRDHSALVYFPEVRQFANFENSQLQGLDWKIEGEVLALRSLPGQPQFAVRRPDGVWIITLDGSLLGSLPSTTVAVLLVDGGILFSLPDSLILQRADGSQLSFDLPGVMALSQMGEGYVQVVTHTSLHALRLTPGRELLSVLPDRPPSRREGLLK